MYSPQLPLARTRVLSPSESEICHADPHPVGVGGLEASLLSLIHHHHHRSVLLRDRTEKARRDAIRSAGAVSDLLVEAVNGGVQEAFLNQKRIELEIRASAATVSRFVKQTDHWLASTHALNSAIKEIGDFENWMKIMDFECKSINAAIRNIHQP
ncbi:biogenesis of lysosome-related organelles complex 1 subunit 1-like [Rhodamnia argentea]|uniref:Biogenesis of lysosome-related organelles complex 1 subunit 1 n=1 Tax=Rhodamnia argentea TaxID=178133 RepID=A0A8B8PT27_9MYRT|nr:biogenesis of lysosome-related organelles complex 1 subunit 1-like [Rhodamnia argentea]XP_048136323.1 biogenesis of lysosome-related organelles complex 1 subunit 1-like [Rhodamnia argentea]